MREITDPFALYYRLKTPCSKCPFRKDSPIELRPGRLEGIVETLLKDQTSTFTCHNTFSSTRDDDDCDDDVHDGDYLFLLKKVYDHLIQTYNFPFLYFLYS